LEKELNLFWKTGYVGVRYLNHHGL